METVDNVDGRTIHVERNDDATMAGGRKRDVDESSSSDQNNALSIASTGGNYADWLQNIYTASTSARHELSITVETVSC
jgi:hypothetical protein